MPTMEPPRTLSVLCLCLISVQSALGGVYRAKSGNLLINVDWNTLPEGHTFSAEGEYLAKRSALKSPVSTGPSERATDGLRPGHPTTTNSCQQVRSVPQELRSAAVMRPDGLDNFYQKYTEAYNIPVLGSSRVPDDALRRACYTLRFMLADHAGIRESFYRVSGRVAIMAATEVTKDIPEHSQLDDYMNTRARGLGATLDSPVSTGAEENVLCEANDPYHPEDIFLHELSHALDGIGAEFVIPGWHAHLEDTYQHAKRTGLWANTYAMTNAAEYFAEGVQSFFNVNDHANPPNGIHNDIDTQAELKTYDPQLYNLILKVFPCNNHYLKRCTSTRQQENSQHIKTDCNAAGETFPGMGTAGCQDETVNCLYWAAIGECQRNPGYMLVNCKASCKVCSDLVGR